jgi:ABC-type transport system involved in cytochrome c biogenesis ATPase subunit
MKFQSLKLNQIQAFEEAEISFGPATIIVGQNNAGKSVFLRALCSFVRDQAAISRVGASTGSIAKLTVLAESQEELLRYTGANNEIMLLDIERTLNDHPRASQVIENIKMSYGTMAAFPIEFRDAVIIPLLSKRKPYSVNEDIRQVTGSQARIDSWDNLSALVDELSSPSSVHHQEYLRASAEILGFTPFSLTSANGKRVGLQARDFDPIYIEDMGSGVTHLTLLIALLVRLKNRVFLIEEPETELHPTALRSLMALMRTAIIERSNQVVVTTHSPIVLRELGKVDGTQVHLVTRKPTGQYEVPLSTVKTLSNDVEGRREALDSLGHSLEDIDMWDAWLITEEASIEPLISSWLIPKYFPELLGRLKILSSGGASRAKKRFDDLHGLALYAHLTAGYLNRAWVLLDGDQAGLDVQRQLFAAYSSWPKSHFVCLSPETLESAYPERFAAKRTEIASENDHVERGKLKRRLAAEVSNWAFSSDAADLEYLALEREMCKAKEVLSSIRDALIPSSNA